MKMDNQSTNDRKRLAGGRLGASRTNPRQCNLPGANSKPHSSAKEMPPSLTAARGNGQDTTPDDGPVKPLDLIWGACNIGQVVNLNTRQTFHALETGAIPARKVGGKWVAERGKLREFFLEGD